VRALPFSPPPAPSQPSVTTGCVSCVSGDGIDGGPVWWTDPYTAWAAKKKADKANKRKGAPSLDDDTEARLKALRGEGSSSAGGGGSGMPPPPPPAAGGASGGGGGGMALDADVEARLRALRGEGGGGGGGGSAPQDQAANKGYDSD
jgi:bud site selection protein 31